MSAESKVQRVGSRILSAVYLVAGALKFPIIPSLHDNMRKQFVNFASVFPGNMIGLRVDPVMYLYVVGALEFTLGLGLLLGSRRVKMYCTEGLMVIMTGALLTLIKLGNYVESVTPAVFLTSLTYLWYTYGQEGKEKRE